MPLTGQKLPPDPDALLRWFPSEGSVGPSSPPQPGHRTFRRVLGSGRDPERSSRAMPLPEREHPHQGTPERIQAGFRWLQGRRLHNPSGQPAPVLCHVSLETLAAPKLGGRSGWLSLLPGPGQAVHVSQGPARAPHRQPALPVSTAPQLRRAWTHSYDKMTLRTNNTHYFSCTYRNNSLLQKK